jgi:hypothetical protein
MKALTTFASAAALAVTLTAAAVPAHAGVFAQFSPDTNASDYKWIKNNTGGEFISITANTDTTAQAVATHFSYLEPSYAALAFLPAAFTIDATAAQGNPASFAAGPGTFTQTGLNGSFSFIYTGPTQTVGIFNLVHNVTNLLSGVFTNAWIQGAGGSGSTNVTIGNGGTATYNSGIVDFSHVPAGSEEFAFNLLNVSPAFGADLVHHKALNTFTANGGGNFHADAVPEPATWGLMIMGFGGIGALIRNRRRQAIATA